MNEENKNCQIGRKEKKKKESLWKQKEEIEIFAINVKKVRQIS